MSDVTFNPALTALLVSAFKFAHLSDEAAGRGADNAMRYLAGSPIFAFDPTESRALSEGSKEGTYYVTNGTFCTCKAKGWCKHCIGHRFALAQLALTDPAELIRLVIEQAVPAGANAADVAAVERAEAAISAAVVERFDLMDDALYADLVAGVPLAPLVNRPFVTLSQADAEIDALYP